MSSFWGKLAVSYLLGNGLAGQVGEGATFMVAHRYPDGRHQALGRLSVKDNQMFYVEPGNSSQNFSLSCREFPSRSKFDSRRPRDLHIVGRDFLDRLHGQSLTPPLPSASEVYEGIAKACLSLVEKETLRPDTLLRQSICKCGGQKKPCLSRRSVRQPVRSHWTAVGKPT